MRWSNACSAILTAPYIRTPDRLILTDPERQLALSYAPPPKRAALALLWQFDERMAAITAAAREPAIAAMRLIWWRDALIRLDAADAPVPAEPLLTMAAATLLPAGLTGRSLAEIEQGWAALLQHEPPGEAEIIGHAEGRGAPLFTMSATLLGAMPADIAEAGEGWALADLGHRLRDTDGRGLARSLAAGRLAQVDIRRWPATLKPLGLLVLLARQDAALPADRLRRQGAPKRLFRGLAYRLTGR